MKIQQKCLVCGSSNVKQTSGLVSPFLARRIWNRKPFPVKISRCKGCGFAFFNSRMDSNEERKLYSGYRSAEYQKMRFACEPWYTETFNANLNAPEVWRFRKSKLADIFEQQFHGPKIASILDFGGDRGELIADFAPGAEHFVYDISNVQPLPGITALSTLEACKQHQFDLILSSNVLEHVGSPKEALQQIQEISSPSTLIFIEVPYESPFSLFTMTKRLAQNGILLGLRPRISLSMLRPGALVHMHEHVNYFCPAALNHLVQSMGWEMVAEGTYSLGIYKVGWLKIPSGRMAWCVAKLRS